MKPITLHQLWDQADINKLTYPDDIQIGMYVFDEFMKVPILITDEDSVYIHKNMSSRKRFATMNEILQLRKSNGSSKCKTVGDMIAYNYGTVIYTLMYNYGK